MLMDENCRKKVVGRGAKIATAPDSAKNRHLVVRERFSGRDLAWHAYFTGFLMHLSLDDT
jgi:hypothetical protein